MKKAILLIAAALGILSACSSGGSGSNISKAVGSASYDYRTDWAKYGLLGLVKTVEYDGYSLVFSLAGRLDDNDDPTTRFKGRVRTDNGYSGYAEYTFDDLGRLILQETNSYKATYTYEGDNFYPSSMVEESEDDYDCSIVKTEHQYTYSPKDFDKAGNWLARTDNGEKVSRKISYYDDPYAAELQSKFKTPEEAAQVMLKALKKLDAETYYSTLEYAFRKSMKMTLEDQRKRFEYLAKDDENRIRSFKIREVKIKFEKTAEVMVDEVHYDGTCWDSSYAVVLGKDGFWYNGAFGSAQQKK